MPWLGVLGQIILLLLLWRYPRYSVAGREFCTPEKGIYLGFTVAGPWAPINGKCEHGHTLVESIGMF